MIKVKYDLSQKMERVPEIFLFVVLKDNLRRSDTHYDKIWVNRALIGERSR